MSPAGSDQSYVCSLRRRRFVGRLVLLIGSVSSGQTTLPSRGPGMLTPSGLGIEQMRQHRIGCDPDRLAGFSRDTLAERAQDGCAAELRHHLRLRSGRLHDVDHSRKPIRAKLEVLRTDAVDDGLAVTCRGRARQRQRYLAAGVEAAGL